MARLSVEQVDPYATVWLRQRVLRAHQTYDEVAAETDVPELFAVGALVERALVACVLAHPDAAPDDIRAEVGGAPVGAGSSGEWRLRGMATDPAHRGQGHAAAVLARMLEELRLRDADLGWCNARTPAEGLYRRAGFVTSGEPWVDPLLGPHVRMWRRLVTTSEPPLLHTS